MPHSSDRAAPLPYAVALGKRVADRRCALGLTQQQVARASGVTRPTIWGIESGQVPCRLHTLVAVAAALQTDPGALLPPASPTPSMRERERLATLLRYRIGMTEHCRAMLNASPLEPEDTAFWLATEDRWRTKALETDAQLKALEATLRAHGLVCLGCGDDPCSCQAQQEAHDALYPDDVLQSCAGCGDCYIPAGATRGYCARCWDELPGVARDDEEEAR